MSKRILVVDDDPDIRQVLLDRLASHGYSVQAVANGVEALDALRGTAYDGMLLDIRMPDLDGLKVLPHVRKSHPRMTVVMMTTPETQWHAVQAMREGAQAFLLKPFDSKQLEQVIVRWFGPAA